MDTQVLTTIIAGMFSLVAALGSVFLKVHLDRKKERSTVLQTSTSPEQNLHASVTHSTREVMWMRPLLIVSASWVLGNISRALRTVLNIGGVHYEAVASMVLLVATALALVVHHRSHSPERGQGFYQLEVFALWAGFASGWSMVHGSAWGDLINVSVAGWLGCAIVGGIILIVLKRSARR